ncbi:MAG: hypothetical protein EAZ97_08840, partial [Bacteroidetes bacterium]
MKYGLSFEDSEHNFNYDTLLTYNGKIAYWHYFWQLNNEFPHSKNNYMYIDYEMLYNKLVKRYKVKAENLWRQDNYDNDTTSY